MKWLKASHERLGTTKYRFHKTKLQRKLAIMNKETTQAKTSKNTGKNIDKFTGKNAILNKDYRQK